MIYLKDGYGQWKEDNHFKSFSQKTQITWEEEVVNKKVLKQNKYEKI